jgi:hypothetical protein
LKKKLSTPYESPVTALRSHFKFLDFEHWPLSTSTIARPARDDVSILYGSTLPLFQLPLSAPARLLCLDLYTPELLFKASVQDRTSHFPILGTLAKFTTSLATSHSLTNSLSQYQFKMLLSLMHSEDADMYLYVNNEKSGHVERYYIHSAILDVRCPELKNYCKKREIQTDKYVVKNIYIFFF